MTALDRAIHRYAELTIRHRWLLIGLAALSVAVAGFGLTRIEFQTHFRIWFQEGRPTLVSYDSMVDRFGSDDQAVIAVASKDGDLMRNGPLGAIRRMTDALWKVEGVKRVDSLANFATIRQSQLSHESPALAVTRRHVAAAGDKHEVLVWSLSDYAPTVLKGHAGLVEQLAASADERWLFSAGLDRTVRIHDLERLETVGVVRGFVESISALTPSRDGRRLYVGSYRRTYVVDLERRRIDQSWEDHDDYVVRIIEGEDGALYTFSREVHVLDPSSGALRARWPGTAAFVSGVATSSSAIFVSSEDGRITRYERGSGAARTLSAVGGPAALSLALSPSLGVLVAGLTDGSVRAFPLRGPGAPIVSRIHDDWVVDLVVDAGGTVYAASRDRNVSRHIPGEGPRVLSLAAHRAAVRRVALVPDGRLVTLGDDGDVYVWGGAELDMQARLRRIAPPELDPAVVHVGPKVGVLNLMNGFRYPIEVRVAGQSGVARGGRGVRLSGLPVPDLRPCGDGSCPEGQYCDWEQDEPVCVGRTRVDAYRPGTDVRIWSGEAFLSADHAVTLRVPSDEPFSVTEAALTPFAEDTRVGALRARHPEPVVGRVFEAVLGEDAARPDTFVSPDVATALAERGQAEADFPPELRQHLTTLAQGRLEPMRLPLQPWRIREATYHLMRPPHPSALGNVLNADHDATMLVVSLHSVPAGSDRGRALRVRRAVEAITAAEASPDMRFEVVGGTIMDTWLEQYAERDLEELGPIFLFVVTALLGVAYRRISGVLVPLGLVGLAIAAAVGSAGWLGTSFNNMTVSVPHVILASCIGDAVHIFSAWSDHVREGRTPREATIEAITHNFMPCLWTSASTAVGFFSLCTSDIAPVRTFGWMAGLGVLVAFTMSVAILPAVTSALPAPRKKVDAGGKAPSNLDDWMDARLIAVAEWVGRSTGAIVFLFLFFFGFAVYGLTKVTIDTNELKFFAADAPFRQAAEFLEDEISGSYSMQIVARLGDKGALRRTAQVEELVALQEHIEQTPEVRSVMSIADTLRTMNRVMTNDLLEDYRVPEADAIVSSYYDAYTFSLPAGLDLTNRVSASEDATLIDVRLVNNPASWFLDWGAALERWADEHLELVKIEITGQSWLYSSLARDVSAGFLSNVGSAVLLISLMLLFLARGLRVGIPAVLANIVPVATTVGVLGLAGQALDMAILVSCCVALGVVVDDTTHFVSKYRASRAKGKTLDEAITQTIRVSGKAMVFTTFILVAGFLTLSWTDFAVNRNFGLVVAAMLTFGLIFDLTVLPALIKAGAAREDR